MILQNKFRKTRREEFLSQMEKSILWEVLVVLIEQPFCPTGKRDRLPIGIERMLRLYFVQLWYNFSD